MEIHTPNWVKHAIFYQIFPDRFARGKPKRADAFDPKIPLEAWDAPPTLQGYKGGNLWGVIDKLDYLRDLGISAIYFTPIFQSASNHRYHTHDYYQVDPILGGNEALTELLAAAHQRNIKVVLDGVFNHASRGFFYFNDILENGPYSPWLDWFKIEGWPLSAYDGDRPANYVGWVGNRALPEFNHDNRDVREYIMQIAEYWLKFGIDGWRLDVPFEVKTPGFWQEFRDRVKAVNPDAYIVGEVWTDSRQWLDGTQFDGVMNYLFTGPTIAFVAGDRVDPELVEGQDYYPYPPIDAADYALKMQHLLALYPWEIQLTQLNLLESHDTTRLLSVVGEDRASSELAHLLLMTFPGAPSIYYGSEVGLAGKRDPDCRRVFPPESLWDANTLHKFRQLIALRHRHPALRTGDYKVLYAEGSTYIFVRICAQEEIIVAINSGEDASRVTLELGQFESQPRRVAYGSANVSWTTEGEATILNLTLPGRSGCVIEQ